MSNRVGYIYLLGMDTPYGYQYKIGRTNSVVRRMDQYAKLPVQIDVLSYYRTEDMFAEELMWHEKFSNKRTRGEWFELNSYDVHLFNVKALEAHRHLMTPSEYSYQRTGIIYFLLYAHNGACAWNPDEAMNTIGYRKHKPKKTYQDFKREFEELQAKAMSV